jgi:SrtB family sortase
MPYYPERKPEAPDKERTQAQAAEKRGKRLRRIIVLVSIALIGYGGVRLLLYQSDLVASRETSRELQEIHEQAETEETIPTPGITVSPAPSPANTAEPLPAAETAPADQNADDGLLRPVAYPDNSLPMISERFLKLRRKSEYIVGWLSMDGVEEAVAQKDNTFFLNHDALGKRNGNGAIFLDEGIRLATRPYTLILYGHNMKSGNMFGSLKKYKESAYFYSHRIISFDSLYEEGQYAVFAVMEMDTTPGIARWYDLWSLTTDRKADREEAIRKLERRSVISDSLDVQAEDQLLILVTCLDGDTERLVVVARRLREGETANHLTIQFRN